MTSSRVSKPKRSRAGRGRAGGGGGGGGLVIGVDVGTGSVRAAVFDLGGRRLGMGVKPIQIWRPQADFVEQSGDDIWRSAGRAVREALAQAGAPPERIIGLSFDATCSLVCVDARGRPVTVSPSGHDERNVIVWMDHRAIAEAERINATGHEVLEYVGGAISPEMEPPKLMWLKKNLRRSWARIAAGGLFLDLADFLAWRATGTDVRSLCTTVCKWTYQGHRGGSAAGGWNKNFWRRIGLGDLVNDGHARIGRVVRPMGEPIGHGLTAAAAGQLGLRPGTAVGVGMIDAHAGGLGMIGAEVEGQGLSATTAPRRLALIGGTSSCHMAVSVKPAFIPGVWGPYYSAMVPGLWLNEGGQSATGALIDHVIESSPLAPELSREARRKGVSVHELLNKRLGALAGRGPVSRLTRNFHVLGDHHGNRSPRADPHARGIVSGLSLNRTLDELAVWYLATVQAVAYGTRHIIEAMNAGRGGRYKIDTVFACGGGTKNPLFVRQHADITGCVTLLPREPEAVLLGAAMLGAVAAGAFPDCTTAMAGMTAIGRRVEPVGGAEREYHEAKYRVYRRMYEDQRGYGRIMAS
ncbi:MAG: FGGY-family carbohydrate kinase [Phycisphaerales bacterium]|nr:FGGY-family carbohydrate kinase [Phycisphaerales bacterium]